MIRHLLRCIACLAIATAAWTADESWNGAGGDDNWTTNQNWSNQPEPNGTGDGATLAGNVRTGPVLDVAVTLNRLTFAAGAGNFTIGGGNGLTMGGTNPFIEVLAGSQTISAELIVSGELTIFVANGASLTVSDTSITGSGNITVFTSGSGSLILETTAPTAPTISSPAAAALTGSSPTWTWSGGTGNGRFRYNIDGGPWNLTSATTFTPASPLANGTRTFNVQERDVAGNWSTTASRTVTVDGTAPVIIARRTRDVDGDGQIDAVDVTFNESMSTNASHIGTWSVNTFTLNGAPTWQSATILRINLVEDTSPDTGTLPTVLHQVNAGSEVQDAAGNFLANEGTAVQPQDGAPAAITTVFGTVGGTSVTVNFSEPVGADATGSPLQLEDLLYVDTSVAGAASFSGVSDGNALDTSASFTTNVALAAVDIGVDQVRAMAGQVVDLANNTSGTARLVTITAPQTFVQTVASGSWQDPTRWSTGVVPSSADAVLVRHAMIITNTGSDTPLQSVRTLTFDTGGSVAAQVDAATGFFCIINVTERLIEARDNVTVTNVQFYDSGEAGETIIRVVSGKTLTLNNATQGHFLKNVVKQGTGNLIWASPANQYFGGPYDDGLTRVEDGIMVATVANARPDGYALTVNSGATFRFTGNYAPSSLDGAGTVGIQTGAAATLTVGSGTWLGQLRDQAAVLAVTVTGTSVWQGSNIFTGRLTVDPAASLTVNGAGVVVADAAPVTLNGTITVLTGETFGPLDGAGSLVMNANTTINHGTTTTSFTGVISGAGTLAITGNAAGSQSLANGQTWTGGLGLLSGGTIVAASNSGLGAATGPLSFLGGTLRLAGNINTTAIPADATDEGSAPSVQIAASAATRTISVSSLDGTIDLQSFSLALPGFDTAAGQDLTIAAAASGDRTLFINQSTGTNTWAGQLLRPVSSTATETFGWFIKRGNGTLVLANGGNTWRKNIVRPEQGTLRVTADGALGQVDSLVFTLAAGIFELGSSYTTSITHRMAGTMRVMSGGTFLWSGSIAAWPQPEFAPTNTSIFDVASGATFDLNGAFVNARPWRKIGAGSLTLSAGPGVNTLSGTGTIAAGIMSIARDDLLGPVGNGLVLDGGTLQVVGSITTARNLTIGSLGGTIDVDVTAALQLGGVVSGSGLINKAGKGPLTLSGSNIHTGDLRINTGTVVVNADAALGSSAGTIADVILNGGQLQASASFPLAATRSIMLTVLGGQLAVADAAVLTFDGVLTGAGQLDLAGPGTLSLGGTNPDFTGFISVNGGTLRATSAEALGDSALVSGTIVRDGASLDLAGTFTCPEPMALNGAGVGSVGTLTASSGAPTLSGAVLVNRTVDAVIVGVAFGPLTISGVVSGQSDLTKVGTGPLHLSGVNTFTGQTTITAGAVGISADSGLGAAANEVLLVSGTLRALANITATTRVVRVAKAGGTVDSGTFNVRLPGIDTAPAQNLTLAGTGNVIFDVSGSLNRTLAGKLSGTATLTKDGAGDLVITNLTNDFTGATVLDTGVMAVAGVLPGSLTVTVGGILVGAGTIGTLNVQAGGVVSPAGAGGAGVLTVGTLNPAAASLFAMNIGAASDLISVTGSTPVALTGAIALFGEDTAPNGSYTLISAPNTTVSGTMSFSPDPNDVNARYRLQTGTTVLQAIRDSVAPQISAITSPDPDGEYVAGDTVTIRVEFSEPVNLIGGLRLTLNTAPSRTVDVMASAVGVYSAAFDGTYTVAAPEIATDLTVSAIALLSAGSFSDAVGNTVSTAALPPQNLGNLKNIAIVNRVPVMAIGTGSAGVTQPPAVAIATQEGRIFDPTINDATRMVVLASDQETGDPASLICRVLLEPSQGEVQYSADASFAPAGLKTVVTTVSDAATQVASFTQADIAAGRVRYLHTALSGGNDAVLMTATDGDGNTSALYLMRFSITGNAEPSIAGLPALIVYDEEATHAVYTPIAAAADVTDDSSVFANGQLTVSVAGATLTTGDEIGFLPGTTGVTVNASQEVYVGAVLVGTLTRTSAYAITVTIAPASTAGPFDIEAILAAIGYRNVRRDPDPSVGRSLQIGITDGTAPETPNLYSVPITLALYNDPPEITVGLATATVPGLPRNVTITASDPEGDTALVYAIAPTPAPQATRGALVPVSPGVFTYTAYYPSGSGDADPLIDSFAVIATDNGFTPGSTDPRRLGTNAAVTSTPAVYQVRISGGGDLAPRFNAPMRYTVQPNVPFTFAPEVTAASGAVLAWELIGAPAQLNAAIPAQASFDPASGQLTWTAVPSPADGSGYYRFSILATDTVNRTAALLPVMLRVGPGGVN